MASLGVLKPRPTCLYHLQQVQCGQWQSVEASSSKERQAAHRRPCLPGTFFTTFLPKPTLTPSCFWKLFSVCSRRAPESETHSGGCVDLQVLWLDC